MRLQSNKNEQQSDGRHNLAEKWLVPNYDVGDREEEGIKDDSEVSGLGIWGTVGTITTTVEGRWEKQSTWACFTGREAESPWKVSLGCG